MAYFKYFAVITLLFLIVAYGGGDTPYFESGASANDNIDGNVTVTISTTANFRGSN